MNRYRFRNTRLSLRLPPPPSAVTAVARGDAQSGAGRAG